MLVDKIVVRRVENLCKVPSLCFCLPCFESSPSSAGHLGKGNSCCVVLEGKSSDLITLRYFTFFFLAGVFIVFFLFSVLFSIFISATAIELELFVKYDSVNSSLE